MTEETEFKSLNKKPGLYKGDFIITVILMLFLLGKEWQAKLPMSDFRVYYRAAHDLSIGKSLYNTAFFYRFKYPPPSAAFFLPFLPFPFWVAKIIMAAILISSLILIFRFLETLWPPGLKVPDADADPALRVSKWRIDTPGALRTFICLSFGGMFLYEFYLGQVTLPILAMLLFSVILLKNERDAWAGLVYAATLHLKPYGWPIFIWGIFRKRVSFVLSTLVFFALIATVTLPFFGLTGSIPQWEGFLHEMSQLNDVQLKLNMPENHTLGSALIRWFHLESFLGEFGMGIFAGLVKMLLLGFPLVIIVRLFPKSSVDEIPWLLAAVPLIGPPEYKYFQLELPLLWFGLVKFSRLSRTQKSLLIIGMLGLGINIYDLWGKKISNWMTQVSVVTVGGLGLYLAGSSWFCSPRKEEIIPFEEPDSNSGTVSLTTVVMALVIFFAVMGYSELRNLQDRLVCRSCSEETSKENTVCKNCGRASLAPYPLRCKEIETAASAAIRFNYFLTADTIASASELLKAEFPELPPEDFQRVISGTR